MRPSSVTTFTAGLVVNFAVVPTPSRVLIVVPIDPSVEPSPS